MNDGTLLLRQIHPTSWDGRRVDSRAFRPLPRDAGAMSVDDGDLTTAEDSWRSHLASPGFLTIGVQAVTVAECLGAGAAPRSDPSPGNPAHALIDFAGMSNSQTRRTAKILRDHAESRGWLAGPA